MHNILYVRRSHSVHRRSVFDKKNKRMKKTNWILRFSTIHHNSGSGNRFRENRLKQHVEFYFNVAAATRQRSVTPIINYFHNTYATQYTYTITFRENSITRRCRRCNWFNLRSTIWVTRKFSIFKSENVRRRAVNRRLHLSKIGTKIMINGWEQIVNNSKSIFL